VIVVCRFVSISDFGIRQSVTYVIGSFGGISVFSTTADRRGCATLISQGYRAIFDQG